jgi:hypothetical protein
MRPPLKIPAPMPVPMINAITSDLPRPAPRQHSPRSAAFRSLSMTTEIPSCRCSLLASGMRVQPGRFGAHTVPFGRTSPGTEIPAAANACAGLPAANSLASSTICKIGAEDEWRSTATRRRDRTRPSRSTTAAAHLVPPRSAVNTVPGALFLLLEMQSLQSLAQQPGLAVRSTAERYRKELPRAQSSFSATQIRRKSQLLRAMGRSFLCLR